MEIITKEEILNSDNEDEIFCLIDEFLFRSKMKGLLHKDMVFEDNLIFLDIDKRKIIDEMIRGKSLWRKNMKKFEVIYDFESITETIEAETLEEAIEIANNRAYNPTGEDKPLNEEVDVCNIEVEEEE